MKRSQKREKLLDAAAKLFAAKGFHQTGIDTILDEAGVAKRTFYNHFPSKDHLILAVLAKEDLSWFDWFEDSVCELSEDPEERLLAIFDVLEIWIAGDDQAGASFLKAIVEYPDPSHPVHVALRERDEMLRDIIRKLTAASAISTPNEIADHLMLLISGAMVEALLARVSHPAQHAKEIGRALIESSSATSKIKS